MDIDQPSDFRAFRAVSAGGAVAHQPYKQDGSAPFRDVAGSVLFHDEGLACEMRYFEVDAGGYSTLERHQHVHGVMILRGHGQCLVGHEVRAVAPFDLVTIPSWTWHQFRAMATEPLGFLLGAGPIRSRSMCGSVAATNVDLAVEGRRPDRFRADLLDRLAFDVVTVPPLRERPER